MDESAAQEIAGALVDQLSIKHLKASDRAQGQVAHALQESLPNPLAHLIQGDTAWVVTETALFSIHARHTGEAEEEQIAVETSVRGHPLEDRAWIVELTAKPGPVMGGYGQTTVWSFRRGTELMLTVEGQASWRPGDGEIDDSERFARQLAGKVGWAAPLHQRSDVG